MAGNTVPWWRRAAQFLWKSIRAVARIDSSGQGDRSDGARDQAASSGQAIDEKGFKEPAIDKIDAGASLELHVEEETALNQESPERLPEESPKSEPEVAPEPVHDQTASAAHAGVAPEERGQHQATPQDPEEIPETPADLLAEAALGIPAESSDEAAPERQPESQSSTEPSSTGPSSAEPVEAQLSQGVDEEAIEKLPSSLPDILAEAVVEDEEPEPPVSGNIQEPAEVQTEAGPEVVEAISESAEEQEAETKAEPVAEPAAAAEEPQAKAGADSEAPEIEAAEAAFDQPVETAAEEAAETALVEEAVGEPEAEFDADASPTEPEPLQSTEAREASAAEGEERQGSAPIADERSAAEADSPKLPPKAASAPPQAVKREEGPDTSPFSVLVSQVYEGPLDLLLDLIRKQDIDIYDIPIAKITAQFLAYVDQLKASDVDVAGEFIYTASLLIHIKSKMLLPRAPAGPDDVQEDPRRELVERLLEHERFKNAAQMLQQKQMLESATWTNPGMREFQDDANTEAEIAADTTDLVRIFREILERARNRPILDVQEDAVTVGQMIQFLTRRLTMEDKPVALRRLLSHTRSERALIAMFLALLELVRLQAILLRQDQQFSEIFIKKNSGFDAFMNQGTARDDWQ